MLAMLELIAFSGAGEENLSMPELMFIAKFQKNVQCQGKQTAGQSLVKGRWMLTNKIWNRIIRPIATNSKNVGPPVLYDGNTNGRNQTNVQAAKQTKDVTLFPQAVGRRN